MAIQTEHSLQLGVEIKKKLKEFDLDISFSAGKGCLGILGPSGCGKSMTLKSIAGIVTPDSGRIALQYAKGEAAGGRVLYDSALKINEKPQMRRVGYLFQNYALFPNMSVEENIAAGLKGMEKKKAKVGEMIERFRLTGLEKRYPGQLSGGQQQRVALARILAYEPEALLLDEPFGALDVITRGEMQDWLLSVRKQMNRTVLLVTHDMDEAIYLSDRILVLDAKKGKVRQEFTVKEEKRNREWLYEQGALRREIYKEIMEGKVNV